VIREAAAQKFFEQSVSQFNIDWPCKSLANLVVINCNLCYNNVYETYKDNTDYIMICTNKNMYNKEHAFYEIADKYVNLYVTLYIDIINNAELFFLVDSCFCCIVYPLMMMNRIPKDNVHVSQIL
jgi:hypothetical protein